MDPSALSTSSDEFATQSPGNAETIPHTSSVARLGYLHVRCPGCHLPIDIPIDTSLTDLTCSSCGSHFSLVDQTQDTRIAAPLSTMGRFELIERLGVGGFGTVWKARDKELDRTVALKIPRQGSMSGEEQEKFFREARAAAQLKHPNIVSVHEVGREGETIFIVSDFVRGVTLGDWLTGQQLTSREAAELCIKIAEALDHAHEKGVVHRDLKPANIMIDGEVQPHLMDFGLARREVGEVTMTMDGQVLGTPAYMSPEQAQGESHTADGRSDVYSLGVILFQLLTGERPFRGNARMLIHQVIHDEPPAPRKFNANIPRDMETIVLKCLEKDPDRRYQTAQDVAKELRRFINGEPIHARPIGRVARGWRWAKKNFVAAAALALLCMLLISLPFTVSLWRAWEGANRAQAIALANADEANKQVSLARASEHEAIKQREIAKDNEMNAKRQEILAKENEHEAIRQREIAVKSRAELAEANATITRQQGKLLSSEANASFLLGAYRQSLQGYINAYDALREVSASTRPVDLGMVSLFRRAPTPLAVHDVGYYAYAICRGPGDNTVVIYSNNGAGVLDVRTGELIRSLRRRAYSVSRCLYLPTKDRLVITDNQGNVEVFDAQTEETIAEWNVWEGNPIQEARPEHLEFRASTNEEFIAWQCGELPDGVYATLWSVDGKKLWSETGESSGASFDEASRLALMGEKLVDLITFTTKKTYELPARIISAAISADGSQAVFGSWHGTLWAYNLTLGKPLRQWQPHKGLVHALDSTADGQWLFSASQDGTIHAWKWAEVFNDQASLATQVFQGDSNSSIWRLAPLADNRRLLSAEAGKVYVWDLNSSDGIQKLLPSNRLRTLKFSNDGQWLLVLAEDKEEINVMLFDLSCGRSVFVERIKIDTPFANTALENCAATLTEDGKQIWLADRGFVRCIDIGTGNITKSWSFPKLGSQCFFSSDGSTFATQSETFLHVWNNNTGTHVASLPVHDSWRRISLSPTGLNVAIMTNSDSLRITPLSGSQEVFNIESPRSRASDDMSWGNDETLYLCGSLNRRLMSVNVNRQQVDWLSSHQRGIRFVSVDSTGNWAMTTSYDGSVKFWDLQSNTAVATLLPEDFPNVKLAPDARVAAFGSGERGLELWNLDWAREYQNRQSKVPIGNYSPSTLPLEALKDLSEWYAYRGAWDWARELRVRYDQQTGRRSSDFLLRCSLAVDPVKQIEQELNIAVSYDSAPDLSTQYWLRRTRQQSDRLIALEEPLEALHDEEADARGIEAAQRAAASFNWEQATPISWQDTRTHLGQHAVVSGKIANVGAIANFWFLNFGERGQFVAVVPKESFGSFPEGAPHSYEGKNVEVFGEIILHKDIPEIILHSPDQIRILGDGQ